MKWLLNSAVIPAGGNGLYSYEVISQSDAGQWLVQNEFTSRIGYQQNADIIKEMFGVNVEVSRDLSKVQLGDDALIMRLVYRVQNPKSKGDAVSPDDFEWAIFRRVE